MGIYQRRYTIQTRRNPFARLRYGIFFGSRRQLSCSKISAINSGSLVRSCLWNCVEGEKLGIFISMEAWFEQQRGRKSSEPSALLGLIVAQLISHPWVREILTRAPCWGEAITYMFSFYYSFLNSAESATEANVISHSF